MPKPYYHRPMFDMVAPLYDLGVWVIGLLLGGEKQLRRLTIDAIAPVEGCNLKGFRLLEICCGTATLALAAVEKGVSAYGLDLSSGMLKVAKAKSQRQNVKLSLVQADAVYIPFKQRTFDRVAASMGFHEMPFEATRGILKEIKRVLKNNGKFILFDYHHGKGFTGFIQKIFFVFAEHEETNQFIRADLQKELRVAGFKNFNRRLLAKGALQIITVSA
jgi:ubiquinone/menaquinone biosynthesis C-methylase UbiE